MTTTLITGANKGLARETARRLLADGHDVWLAARDAELGAAAAEELGGRRADPAHSGGMTPQIDTRRLGGTGPTVSSLGLGCMGLSGAYGPPDEASERHQR